MSDENKPQSQWIGDPTNLSSFNSYGIVTLSDGQRVNVQFTMRHGVSAEKWREDLRKYIGELDFAATDLGVKFWDGNKAAQPKENTMVSDGEKSEKSEHRYDQPLSQAELPAELAEITADVFQQDFDYFVVEPQLDEKSSVKFFKDNLEWAVGAQINKWKYATIKEFLAPLGQPIDPEKAAKYRVAGVQYWKKGAEYTATKGKNAGKKTNYKDLLLVKETY